MNKNTLFLFSFLFSHFLMGQQLPIFTQYRQYQSYLNPAAINSDFYTDDYNLTVGLSMRTQWVLKDFSPQTGLLYGEYIHKNSGGFGLIGGLNIINDSTDPFSLTGVYGRIGAIYGDDYSGFSAGLTIGGVQYRYRVRTLRSYLFPGGINPADPLVNRNYTQWFPDVGAGVYYYSEIGSGFLEGDVFYAGISVPQVLNLDYVIEDGAQTIGVRRVPHFFGLAGLYKYLASGSYLELSTWIKYLEYRNSVHADFNFRGTFEDTFWGGLGFSTTGMIHLEAGVLLGENLGLDTGFKLGYSYDYPFITEYSNFGASHEINLAFNLQTR